MKLKETDLSSVVDFADFGAWKDRVLRVETAGGGAYSLKDKPGRSVKQRCTTPESLRLRLSENSLPLSRVLLHTIRSVSRGTVETGGGLLDMFRRATSHHEPH